VYDQQTQIQSRRRRRKRSDVASVIQTPRQVEVLIRPPWVNVQDRPAGRRPTKRGRSVLPVHRLSLQSLTPPFSVYGGTAIHHRSVQLADVLPRARAISSPDRLEGQLVLCYPKLSGRHGPKGLPVRDGVHDQVTREASQGLESDV
jgi:hypothetical protein